MTQFIDVYMNQQAYLLIIAELQKHMYTFV